jgi:hypothetical protein
MTDSFLDDRIIEEVEAKLEKEGFFDAVCKKYNIKKRGTPENNNIMASKSADNPVKNNC